MKRRKTNFTVIQEWAQEQTRPANTLAYKARISESLARGLISGKYHYLPGDDKQLSISKAIGKTLNEVFPRVETDLAA